MHTVQKVKIKNDIILYCDMKTENKNPLYEKKKKHQKTNKFSSVFKFGQLIAGHSVKFCWKP